MLKFQNMLFLLFVSSVLGACAAGSSITTATADTAPETSKTFAAPEDSEILFGQPLVSEAPIPEPSVLQ